MLIKTGSLFTLRVIITCWIFHFYSRSDYASSLASCSHTIPASYHWIPSNTKTHIWQRHKKEFVLCTGMAEPLFSIISVERQQGVLEVNRFKIFYSLQGKERDRENRRMSRDEERGDTFVWLLATLPANVHWLTHNSHLAIQTSPSWFQKGRRGSSAGWHKK